MWIKPFIFHWLHSHGTSSGCTNIKHSCRVIAPHFTLSWTVHNAQVCLFITNCTFTMATQSTLDWNIHEVERAHNKHPETAFAWARTFNDACLLFLHQVLIFSAHISQAPQQEHWMRGNRVTAQRIVLMEISFLPRYSTWFLFPLLQINEAIFSCNECRVEGLYADLLPWHVNLSLCQNALGQKFNHQNEFGSCWKHKIHSYEYEK